MNIEADINKAILSEEVTDRTSAKAYITAVLSDRGVGRSFMDRFEMADALCRNRDFASKEECLEAIKNYK